MRFMVLVPGSPESEAGEMPSTELLEAMTKYNEELVKAGRDACRRGPAPDLQGREGPLQRQRADRHRRPVHRGQGADRGLLDLGVRVARGGDRVAQARAVRRRRRDRAAPDLRRRRTSASSSRRSCARPTSGCASRPTQRTRRVDASATHRAIDAVWRIESARLIAGLTRIVRDVAVAEDLAQDALVAALEQWPQSGIPDNPGAWLMATAKRRGIDALRRRVALERKHELIGRELQTLAAARPARPRRAASTTSTTTSCG